MEAIPLWLLLVLLFVAIGAGLWVGGRAGTAEVITGKKEAKPIGARIRDATGKGLLSMWKWNRARKKKNARLERSEDDS